jgi:hypothetical protein
VQIGCTASAVQPLATLRADSSMHPYFGSLRAVHSATHPASDPRLQFELPVAVGGKADMNRAVAQGNSVGF